VQAGSPGRYSHSDLLIVGWYPGLIRIAALQSHEDLEPNETENFGVKEAKTRNEVVRPARRVRIRDGVIRLLNEEGLQG
jgi:hypothetical protein